ncbi:MULTISPECIES: PvdJ/PvdD/PvdP-like protein [unclassified Pseudomonas]|uniref:pyoverdine maturation tyrosinase PvdP n=1 Tax=unclassified Pseudomonas TaxID=196821 RepID=UPI002447E58E|nr:MULTISPECIES: PvdJ/PvdD/PvdP-like protein [unclassified Pseudomonas]MDH0894625.1 PvdJ/PvdD/PvdP-like protein [Pseudomonas sp. GD03875]MDH1067240.1 PvdJ/PvdD/PvdP-like protein [Pseudomonas sp. GD03985]
MKFSRRGFVAGLAVAVALPAGIYYAHREWEDAEAAELSSDEPGTPVPVLQDALLASRLVGVWDVRFIAGRDGFPEIPPGELQLLLDVGPGGRALRGYLGKPPYGAEGLQVFGQLAGDKAPELRLTMVDGQGCSLECTAIFDEIWGEWSTGGGAATLSGHMRRSGVQAGLSTSQSDFVAVRRPFVSSRERLPYAPELEAWLVSPGHRLFHQLWHASRDRWHRLDETRRQGLRALGWQAGPLGEERDARGKHRHRNGSGEDFLFMHRKMLMRARSLQDLPSWPSLPPPRPYIGHGIQAFVDYLANLDGFSVPPAWEAEGDDEFNQWLYYIKSSEGYYGDFQAWEAQYRDPEYLSTLCLSELGARIELGIHDWLHMRWASIPRDPNSGFPALYGRDSADFAERWFRPGNDYLGDPFSSHVDPVFWSFHGWIDDRIEDWFLAHEQAHPGQVVRKVVDGVHWFAPGLWVRVAEPWLGPINAGCGAWGRGNRNDDGELDIETMKLALRIVFTDEEEAERLEGRVPRRPWYGRHLARGASRA